MKLNWKSDGETWAEARASRVIGGYFRIQQSGGELCYGHRPPIVYQVRWYESGGSRNTPWIGIGETFDEAKMLAQQAHDRAERASASILKQAQAAAQETLKKAPRTTEAYRQRQAEIQRKLLEDGDMKILGINPVI